jgi:hypothetical protein
MIMEELENDFIKFWFENGILYSRFKKTTDGTLENIKEIIDLRHQISNNKKQYWCYDFNGIKSYDKLGRDYAEKNGQEHLYGCAILLNSHITKFILNTFMTLKKPVVPLKGFTNKEDAVNWLNELMKKNGHDKLIGVKLS